MNYPITIGGRRYVAETAAITCIRYRSQFGASPVAALVGAASEGDFDGRLVKLTYAAVSPEESLAEFAELCRGDRGSGFRDKALALRAEILRSDDSYRPAPGGEKIHPADFDEFDILARMGQAGISQAMIYELPILQLGAVVNRGLEYKAGKRAKTQMVKATPQEVAGLLGAC